MLRKPLLWIATALVLGGGALASCKPENKAKMTPVEIQQLEARRITAENAVNDVYSHLLRNGTIDTEHQFHQILQLLNKARASRNIVTNDNRVQIVFSDKAFDSTANQLEAIRQWRAQLILATRIMNQKAGRSIDSDWTHIQELMDQSPAIGKDIESLRMDEIRLVFLVGEANDFLTAFRRWRNGPSNFSQELQIEMAKGFDNGMAKIGALIDKLLGH